MNTNNLLALSPFFTVYFSAVSVLYLLGYWSGFNITILDYMTISDVFKSAITPLLGTLIALTASVLFSEFVLVRHFPLYKKDETEKDEFLEKKIKQIKFIVNTVLVMAITAIFISLFLDREIRWQIIGSSIAIIMGIFIGDVKILGDISSDPVIRKIIAFICVFLLCSSYSYGVRESSFIKKYGKEIMVENKPVNKKLIGVAGDYMFFWDIKGDFVDVARRDSIKSIQILPADSGPVLSINWSEIWDGMSSCWSSDS
ncbi:hypothetical protein [Aeromonas salmonicida]|uniref:hypothetical protein n=1 Tax=Aeromonas salmonicida TaxID=645 RepID=UPI00223EC74F|nr:hypothetical protein [Aeromonas salmonicida]